MMVTLTIMLAELVLVLACALAVVAYRAIRRRRQDKAAVNSLVKTIQEKSSERQQTLTELLMKSQPCEGDVAFNMAAEVMKKQNEFYQSVIDLYYNRNHNLLGKLDERLEAVLEGYRDIINSQNSDQGTVSVPAEQAAELTAIRGEIEALRSENSSLLKALESAQRELDQMSNEYLSAFNKKKQAQEKANRTAPREEIEVATAREDNDGGDAGDRGTPQDDAPTFSIGDASLDASPEPVADNQDAEARGEYDVNLEQAVSTESADQDTKTDALLHMEIEELVAQAQGGKPPV